MLLAGPPGLGKTSLAQIVAAELDVPFVQTAGPGARAQGRRRRVPDRARAAVGVLRRRDPPAAAGARGDVLSGDGGPRAADHGRPGRGGPGRHDRAAAVHADRRDHPHRPADDAAARPLRDPAPARALRGPRTWRGSCAARPGCSAWRSTTTARWRSPSAAAARRAWPTGCSSGCATTPRSATTASSPPRSPPPRSISSRSTTRGSTGSTARSCARSARSSRGGPVGLSTLAVAVGEEQDTIEDVYEPYLLQRGLIERTPRGRAATRRAYEHLGLEAPATTPSLL